MCKTICSVCGYANAARHGECVRCGSGLYQLTGCGSCVQNFSRGICAPCIDKARRINYTHSTDKRLN